MVDMVSGASSTGNTDRSKPDISSKRGRKKRDNIANGGIILTKVTSAKPKRRKHGRKERKERY